MRDLYAFLQMTGATKSEIREIALWLFGIGGLLTLKTYIEVKFSRFYKYNDGGVVVIKDRKNNCEYIENVQKIEVVK